jgi:hypothetical protein
VTDAPIDAKVREVVPGIFLVHLPLRFGTL